MLQLAVMAVAVALSILSECDGYTIPRSSNTPKLTYRAAESASTFIQMTYEEAPDPTTFREAEVLGLRLMQEGSFEEALVGTLFIGPVLDGGMRIQSLSRLVQGFYLCLY